MLWQLQLQWFDRPKGLFHRRLLRHLATNGSDATSFPPNASSDGSGSIDDDVIAYAVPTFQCPSSFTYSAEEALRRTETGRGCGQCRCFRLDFGR